MSKQISVTLLEPIKGHAGNISEITFREPRYRELIDLGELTTYAQSEDGIMFTSENSAVIKSYLERLLVKPEDPALLNQLCLADTMAAKKVIYDFFGTARELNLVRGRASSSSS